MKNKVQKNKYKEYFDFSQYSNPTIFRLFSEFFNKLVQEENVQKKYDIKILAYLKNKEFLESVRLDERYSETQILLEFDSLLVNISFEVYKQHGEVHYHIYISSNKETNYDVSSFFNQIFKCAIELSDLKGSVFSMPRNELEWEKLEIENISFDDIFLPQSTLDDLKLYINTAKNTEIILRYLLVGHPGTGKTVATKILSNLLNKENVTIIKTSVCDKFRDKYEFAKILAPSIMLIDDIDLSLGSRNKGVHPERLQDLLDILDGTQKSAENVGIIATTNSTALLDTAVQRPGRFDKILMFDELKKENVRSIILKSLNDNFKIKSEKNKFVTLFTHPSVITLLFNSSVTGSYIYTKVKILKIKAEMNQEHENINTDWVLNELRNEMKILKKAKNTDFLGDKLSNSSKNIGFDNNENEEDYENDQSYVEEQQPTCEDEVPTNKYHQRLKRDIIKKFKNGQLNFEDDED